MEEVRLRLKPKAKKERIEKALREICDKRFLPLQKKLVGDLDKTNYKSVTLGLYMRLGGWSHTGGTYANTMGEVKVLCEAMFGYALPEKIGKIYFKAYRYRTGESMEKIGGTVMKYHEEHIK